MYEVLRGLSMQTTAELMRVVEIPCRFRSYSGTEQGRLIERVLRVMETNYGLAGPAFMDGLFTRRPEAFAEASEQALEWDGRVRQSTEERFWTYGLGLILAAGRLACQEGLLNYDVDILERWILEELFPKLRNAVMIPTVKAMNLMTMFLNENLESMLVVLSADRRNRPAPGMDGEGDGWIVKEPRRTLHIRLELDTRTFFIQARHLEAWCLANKVSIETILEGLEAKGRYDPKLDRQTVLLGKGVGHLSRGQLMCYTFRDMEVPDGYASLDT
jgi:hypothetical protein